MHNLQWEAEREERYKTVLHTAESGKVPDNPIVVVDPVTEFENKIAAFFGAPYAVLTDSCTSAVELCLRHTKAPFISVPHHTYLSIPFLAGKLGIELRWFDTQWQDYYFLTNRVADAAVLWRKESYIPGTFMCLSFQYRKHLSLGRCGAILCDNKEDAIELKKMSYDGRSQNIPWREQDITSVGYHYYATPETAQLGLDKLDTAIATPPKQWRISDWPNLREMTVFKEQPKHKEITPFELKEAIMKELRNIKEALDESIDKKIKEHIKA
jgi:dTDP-4-amino-4,6-dideoxygalactose transaminase